MPFPILFPASEVSPCLEFGVFREGSEAAMEKQWVEGGDHQAVTK